MIFITQRQLDRAWHTLHGAPIAGEEIKVLVLPEVNPRASEDDEVYPLRQQEKMKTLVFCRIQAGHWELLTDYRIVRDQYLP